LGVKYAQWLAIGPFKPTNKAATISMNFKKQIVVQLPSDDWYAKHQMISSEDGTAKVVKSKSVLEIRLKDLWQYTRQIFEV
jgi:hypothetical protein